MESIAETKHQGPDGVFSVQVGATFEHVLPGLKLSGNPSISSCTLFVVTLLFAMIYKLLPDAPIRWDDVWIGTGITCCSRSQSSSSAVYLESGVGVGYGAAGSLVVMDLGVLCVTDISVVAEFTAVGRRTKPLVSGRYELTCVSSFYLFSLTIRTYQHEIHTRSHHHRRRAGRALCGPASRA